MWKAGSIKVKKGKKIISESTHRTGTNNNRRHGCGVQLIPTVQLTTREIISHVSQRETLKESRLLNECIQRIAHREYIWFIVIRVVLTGTLLNDKNKTVLVTDNKERDCSSMEAEMTSHLGGFARTIDLVQHKESSSSH